MDPATSSRSTAVPHTLKLSAAQEELLFAALNSNNKSPTQKSSNQQPINQSSMPPSTNSPLQQAPGSGTLGGFEESPFVDYEYDFDADGRYDFGFTNDFQGQMIGRLPGASSDGDGEADFHDKRSHPDDDDEDDEGGGKRRESDGKTSKKPGRKPLTSEPTSKRKAQNRAAQRAFRERKEKHLKDLETKVEDLEKASEAANHENSLLRAKMEKMSAELQEYKKRFAATNGLGRSSSLNNGRSSYQSGNGLGVNNPSDVNFSFEFPKFGRFPGPPQTSLTNLSSPSDFGSPNVGQQNSPRNQSFQSPGGSITGNSLTQTPAQMPGGDMSSFSGLFSPTLLESVSKSPQFDFFGNSIANTNGSRSSTDSASNNNTSYSSPSASSNGHHATNSSCGTSPEPPTQSPHYSKPPDTTLTTIGEERTDGREGELSFCDKLNMACGNANQPIPRMMSKSAPEDLQPLQYPAFDFNGIDWFAQQNGNQFDPQLFGDYREPQDNITLGEGVTDSFFSDAFALPDFQTPFNIAPSPAPPKKDLPSLKDDNADDEEEVVPGEDRSKLLNCNTIWDRLQACPKAKEADFDLDLLCKDLQKKAKCSETGAVVNESDFNTVLQNYVGGGKNTTKF